MFVPKFGAVQFWGSRDRLLGTFFIIISAMGKKRKALLSEVTEYNSLIRALQTTDSFDLTTVQPAEVPSNDSPGEGSLKQRSRAKREGVGGGLSVRWPLLPQDVSVPEWGLDDEIRLLASRAGREEDEEEEELNDRDKQGDDDEEEEEEEFPSALCEAARAYLSAILAHVAAHVPLTAKSLQDRFSPFGWESVLQIVGAGGLCDESYVWFTKRNLDLGCYFLSSLRILVAVTERMESIYGESGSTGWFFFFFPCWAKPHYRFWRVSCRPFARDCRG